MDMHKRLEEMGLYYRMGGTSADVSGSNTLARLVDGDSGGGGGAPGQAFPWIASRVAETARAVMALHLDDQHTVYACYCAPLGNQALQAAALEIKVSALQKRLRRIHLILEEWVSPEARDARRAASRERELADNLHAAAKDHDERMRLASLPKQTEQRGARHKKGAKRSVVAA